MKAIPGYCPMGCGETLYISIGTLLCWSEDCPRPTAAQEIISEPETEHIVVLEERSFAIQHPLRERLDGDLFHCDLHDMLSDAGGPPQPPGRYRVAVNEGTWDDGEIIWVLLT